MGAMMESKNLRAFSVRGTGSVKIAKSNKFYFYEAVKSALRKVTANPF